MCGSQWPMGGCCYILLSTWVHLSIKTIFLGAGVQSCFDANGYIWVHIFNQNWGFVIQLNNHIPSICSSWYLYKFCIDELNHLSIIMMVTVCKIFCRFLHYSNYCKMLEIHEWIVKLIDIWKTGKHKVLKSVALVINCFNSYMLDIC